MDPLAIRRLSDLLRHRFRVGLADEAPGVAVIVNSCAVRGAAAFAARMVNKVGFIVGFFWPLNGLVCPFIRTPASAGVFLTEQVAPPFTDDLVLPGLAQIGNPPCQRPNPVQVIRFTQLIEPVFCR